MLYLKSQLPVVATEECRLRVEWPDISIFQKKQVIQFFFLKCNRFPLINVVRSFWFFLNFMQAKLNTSGGWIQPVGGPPIC